MTELAPPIRKYLEAAKTKASVYRQASRGIAERKRDENLWQRFSDYLRSKDPWDATDQDVAAWCASLANHGLVHRTIQNYLGSLSYSFSVAGKGESHGRPGVGTRKDNPAKSKLVQSTLRGIRRVQRPDPKRKAPLMLRDLDRLIDVQPANLTGIRNRAMFAVAWSAALRRHELLSLDVGQAGSGAGSIDIDESGVIINLPRWSGNRHGKIWETICVPARKNDPAHCPTSLLVAWLKIYDADEGPLFPQVSTDRIFHNERAGKDVVSRAFKNGIRKLRLPVDEYSTLSLRFGCLEWMAEQGVPLDQIMRHGGFRSVERALPYVKPYRAILDSPLMQTQWHR